MAEPLDLEPIKARLAAATPGPWESDIYPGSENWVYVGGVRGPGPSLELGADSSGDAEFITNAPTDIAALVAEVERLRAPATPK